MTERLGGLLSDAQIDRLVDGELSEHEYRAIVAALDVEPDGWRRCALAFLESQAWRKELPLLCQPGQTPPVQVKLPARGYKIWSHATAMLLASAATLLVAFGLPQRSDHSQNLPTLVNKPAVSKPPTVLAQDSLGPEQFATPLERAEPYQPLGRMTLIAGEQGGQPREIQVPVFPLDHDVAATMLESNTPVPLDIENALRRLGYDVRRNRHWSPVDAGNRQVFVPLEQVEIKPVSNFTY